MKSKEAFSLSMFFFADIPENDTDRNKQSPQSCCIVGLILREEHVTTILIWVSRPLVVRGFCYQSRVSTFLHNEVEWCTRVLHSDYMLESLAWGTLLRHADVLAPTTEILTSLAWGGIQKWGLFKNSPSDSSGHLELRNMSRAPCFSNFKICLSRLRSWYNQRLDSVDLEKALTLCTSNWLPECVHGGGLRTIPRSVMKLAIS